MRKLTVDELKLYEAVSQLSDTELATDRGAFWGSSCGT